MSPFSTNSPIIKAHKMMKMAVWIVGIKVLVVAPYRGLAELIASMAPELSDFELTVVQGDLSEVLPYLDSSSEEKYDMIISRGGTARLIRKHTALPVVEIKVSGYDILRLLSLIKGYQAQLEMIGFPNIIESVASVAGLLDIDISCSVIQHEREAGQALEEAKRRGAMIIVGDTVTVRLAAEAGLQGVLITSGRESVLEAFHDARQLYGVARAHRARSGAFAQILDRLEAGAALVDRQGNLRYANDAFFELMRIKPEDRGQKRLRDFPHMEELLRDLEDGTATGLPVMLHDSGERPISIAGGPIVGGDGRHLNAKDNGNDYDNNGDNNRDNDGGIDADIEGGRLYYLLARQGGWPEEEIRLFYPQKFIDSFPQLVLPGSPGGELTEEAAGRLRSGSPVALSGERGTGKRLYAGALQDRVCGKEGRLIGVELLKGTAAAGGKLLGLLGRPGKDAILYIRGIERLPLSVQRQLSVAASRSGAKVVYGFETDPAELADDGLLDAELYAAVRECLIPIRPLRERRDELEELARSFIVRFNERYGKQIVGLRPQVAEALRHHPWDGNMLELKAAVELFVRTYDGPYIEEEALELLKSAAVSGAAKEPAALIDLNRPLEAIERDIIRSVLEEEQGNQSKAAKRLGINRSTLWRKLKELP